MIGGTHNPDYGIEKHGLENVGHIYWTCVPPILYEQATFSGCFGAGFMVRNPSVYASLSGKR